MSAQRFDVVVVGGGPSGSTAAWDLVRAGYRVLLVDREGRPKPCGGAVPPKLVEEFEIPDELLVARVHGARMIAPSGKIVEMPIEDGYVGMVDRAPFDAWLRQRARDAGAAFERGEFSHVSRTDDGVLRVHLKADGEGGEERVFATRYLIGADGARSNVARQCIPGAHRIRYVAAYHEIVASPVARSIPGFQPDRCDVYYQGHLSPDFYGWVFPHGATTSVGVGTARRGFSLRGAVASLRDEAGLEGMQTIRREGAPIPLKPLRRWDNGRDVLVAGDAAGVVAPASGEGIYYAMTAGRMAADAVAAALATGDVVHLKDARKAFMASHGRVFWVLGIMQAFWYSSDKRRESFVKICRDADVQRLTWQAYLHKRLVRAEPMAHLRIFFKDLAHLLGLARA
jgi:geranylgeranyl diphosphate/geranylgeranyl-bacteriochlorophyllide a reductase